jgi:hypothetical protein
MVPDFYCDFQMAQSLATSLEPALKDAADVLFRATQDERGTVHALSQEVDDLVGDGMTSIRHSELTILLMTCLICRWDTISIQCNVCMHGNAR